MPIWGYFIDCTPPQVSRRVITPLSRQYYVIIIIGYWWHWDTILWDIIRVSILIVDLYDMNMAKLCFAIFDIFHFITRLSSIAWFYLIIDWNATLPAVESLAMNTCLYTAASFQPSPRLFSYQSNVAKTYLAATFFFLGCLLQRSLCYYSDIRKMLSLAEEFSTKAHHIFPQPLNMDAILRSIAAACYYWLHDVGLGHTFLFLTASWISSSASIRFVTVQPYISPHLSSSVETAISHFESSRDWVLEWNAATTLAGFDELLRHYLLH